MNVMDWLLAGDVSVQYQTRKYLLGEDDHSLQKRIETEGFGAQFLKEKHNEDGTILGNKFYSPKWTSLHYTLLDLKHLEISKANLEYQKSAVYLLHKLWFNKGITYKKKYHLDLCIVGMLLEILCYGDIHHEKLDEMIDFILGSQLEDGAWNCRSEFESNRSSVHTTINVLEGLAEYVLNGYSYRKDEIMESMAVANEYLLSRFLFRKKSINEIMKEAFLKMTYPARWHYDILRALYYFQKMNIPYDYRMQEALNYIESKNKDNRWSKFGEYQGKLHFRMEE